MARERLLTSSIVTHDRRLANILTKHPQYLTERAYEAGQPITLQGEVASDALLLLSGTAKYQVSDAEGVERSLAILRPGALVSGVAALDGHVNQVGALAVTKVRGLAISGASLRHLMQTDGEFALEFGLVLAQTARLSVKLNVENRFRKASDQLRCMLHHLAREADPEQLPVTMAITQQNLADLLGLSRNTISQELLSLQDRGIVRLGHGKIHILTPDGLACNQRMRLCVALPELNEGDRSRPQGAR